MSCQSQRRWHLAQSAIMEPSSQHHLSRSGTSGSSVPQMHFHQQARLTCGSLSIRATRIRKTPQRLTSMIVTRLLRMSMCFCSCFSRNSRVRRAAHRHPTNKTDSPFYTIVEFAESDFHIAGESCKSKALPYAIPLALKSAQQTQGTFCLPLQLPSQRKTQRLRIYPFT